MPSEQDLFLSDHHAGSRRFVIFEDDGRSAWLYLTQSGSQKPEKDAFVYSPIAPVETDEAKAAAREGTPPPLALEFAASEVPMAGVTAAAIAFRWSEDGHSACLLLHGEPWSMITADARRGYSRAVGKAGFYGQPWDESVYRAHFGA